MNASNRMAGRRVSWSSSRTFTSLDRGATGTAGSSVSAASAAAPMITAATSAKIRNPKAFASTPRASPPSPGATPTVKLTSDDASPRRAAGATCMA